MPALPCSCASLFGILPLRLRCRLYCKIKKFSSKDQSRALILVSDAIHRNLTKTDQLLDLTNDEAAAGLAALEGVGLSSEFRGARSRGWPG